MSNSKSIIVNKLKSRIEGRTVRFNKSTVFLLPMLLEIKFFMDSNFGKLINIYYHTENDLDYNNSYKNRIYCVFDKYSELVDTEKLKKSVNYLGVTEVDDYIIYIFKVPYYHINDYTLFKKGMYSSMSEDYKKLLLSYNPSNAEYLKRILYPTEEDRNQLSLFLQTREKIKEVYSSPNNQEEIFKVSNFYKIKL